MKDKFDEPLNGRALSSLKACAGDALKVLGVRSGKGDSSLVVAALDGFVRNWQVGKRPPADVLTPEDAPFVMGSLWGEQLANRFMWEWRMVSFHDGGGIKATGVLSPDRSLIVYPISFLKGCFQDPSVDVNILMSYNMLAAGKIRKLEPQQYFNLMDGVHRILPRK